MTDRCNITATVTLTATWVASLVGHESEVDMVNKLRSSLLVDVDEVTTLPGVRVLNVEISTR